MLKINNLPSSEMKINNLTLTSPEFGEKCPFFQKISARFARKFNSQIIFLLASLALNFITILSFYPTLSTYTYNVSMDMYHYILYISIQIYMFKMGNRPSYSGMISKQTCTPLALLKMVPFCMKITEISLWEDPKTPFQSQLFLIL